MKIVFVDNLLLEFRDGAYQFDLQPHLGLISLAAVAAQGGHEVALYDPKLELARGHLTLDDSLYRAMADAILAHNPDVVGLTSLGCNFICTVKIAAYLKARCADLPILLGGPHATILDRPILAKFPQFDVIVRHEAEHTLLPVLDALSRRRFFFIPGISFRNGQQVIVNPGEPLIADLDTLPWPAYDVYPLGDLHLDSIRVEAGRGCPFSCTFCSTATFFGRKFRLKSADRIRAEMDYLHGAFGISHFSLTHDLFTVNRAKVVEFCERAAGSGYSWSCSARMDCVDERLLEQMRASGCKSIYYGIETGSARMQKVVDKRQDLGMVRPILDLSDRLNLFSTVSLITGYPQEDQSDQDDTLDLVGDCFHRNPSKIRVQLHLLTPEPGTRLLQEFGGAMQYDGHITDFNFPTLEADDAAIMGGSPDVFMNHHYFPTVLPRSRHVFATTLFAAMYELGFVIVRHALSFYEARFSRLVADAYAYADGQVPDDPEAFLVAFAAHRWGEAHYMVSLLRYIIVANRISKAAAADEQFGGRTADRSDGRADEYRLSPKAQVVRSLHDCKRILDLLAADPRAAIAPDLATRRADRIVLSTGPSREFRNYELEEGWADLYEELTVARSYRHVVGSLAKRARGRISSRDLLGSLLQEGILSRGRDACPPSPAPEISAGVHAALEHA